MSAVAKLRLAPSQGLLRLVSENAPLWAGEVAVFAAYWDAPMRTRETDLTWLARQCRKELYDGVLPRVRNLDTLVRRIGSESDREALTGLADGIQTEMAHFRAFAGVYDQLRTPEDPPLDTVHLERAEWPENRALAELRARHREQYGELGWRAEAFTEGGYCTLYTEGRSLAGRGGIDDAIAAACATVVDDEWDHMIAGVAGLDAETFSDENWALLATLTVEQARCRIRMRNSQFGRPLGPDELRAAEIGALPPPRLRLRARGVRDSVEKPSVRAWRSGKGIGKLVARDPEGTASTAPGSARRIAFLLDNLEGGGVQRMTLVLAGEFARNGFDVDLLVCQMQGELVPVVPPRIRLVALEPGGGLATCRLALSSGAFIATAVAIDQILAHRWLRYARCLPPLTKYLATDRPACLISATPRINILAVLATRAAGGRTRSIVTERISISAKLADQPEFRFRQLIPLMKRSYRLASRVVAVSHDLADDVATQLELPREHVLAIHNPVVGPALEAAAREPLDDPWFSSGAPPVVLSAGRSSDQKDFETLLRAFADVRRQRPCRLVILGQQIGRSRKRRHERLLALADELGIRDDVRLLGFMMDPFPYMANAAIFVLSSRYEGLPGVLIQAMACGTPVVSTACPTGPREILEDGRYGLLVPVGDASAMGKAILETLADPPGRQPLIDRARHFSVDRAFARYRELAFGSDGLAEESDRSPS